MAEERPIGIDDPELDDAALEALAEAHAAPPPADLRARLLAEVRREAAAHAAAAAGRWRLAGSVAAAIGLVLAGLLARESRLAAHRGDELAQLAEHDRDLAARLDEQGRTLAALRESVAAGTEVLRVIGAPRLLSASLAPKEGAGASGRVVVDAASGDAVVILSGLAPAPEGKTYELWALRGDRPPEPAGVFAVGPEGSLARRAARVERPGDVTAFAVSVEPAAGSPSPTGPIVLVGTVAG